MADLPPPAFPDDDRFVTPPTYQTTAELLFRFQRLILAMAIAAIVLAVLPVPAVVHVLVLMVLPVFVLISALSYHDAKRNLFIHRYTRRLWEFRHDRTSMIEAGDRAAEPVSAGLRRAWLLLGMFVGVFLIGLVLAGVSAGISEGLYR